MPKILQLEMSDVNVDVLSGLSTDQLVALDVELHKFFLDNVTAENEVIKCEAVDLNDLLFAKQAVLSVLKNRDCSPDGFDSDGNAVGGFDDEGGLIEKQAVPPRTASIEEKRKAQKERSKRSGIEALEGKGERLSFPPGFPTDLRLYGDSCNLLFPLSPDGRARNARARFKQFADRIYEKTKSKRIVHTRIVKRLIAIGAKPSFDPKDKLDALLPSDLKDQLQKAKKQTTEIQTLILDKKRFPTLADAKKWIKDNNFKIEHKGKGPDETEASFRFRQRDPGDFQDGSFRTINITDGVKAVIGRPKQQTRATKLIPVDKADDNDQRIVFGVVLEPGTIDAQNDKISAEEIEQAAHNWLAKSQDRGFQHTEIVNGKIEIFESFVAKSALTISKQQVKKGTWLLMYHVLDDAMWADIKKGKITGFSIGGFARRKPTK